eukprot:evm.model.scf_291.4 EVM.evm.TU.scf_291.4   scf_291:31259-33926(+)
MHNHPLAAIPVVLQRFPSVGTITTLGTNTGIHCILTAAPQELHFSNCHIVCVLDWRSCDSKCGGCEQEKTRIQGASDIDVGRRRVLAVGVGTCLFTFANGPPSLAESSRGFRAYIKQKELDPLDTYVAPLLAAKQELIRSGEMSALDVNEARRMLRSGALSGLRTNVRATGVYAEQLETSSEGSALATGVIHALEEYDMALLLTSRDQVPQTSVGDTLASSLQALDKLLETVPADVMGDILGTSSEDVNS